MVMSYVSKFPTQQIVQHEIHIIIKGSLVEKLPSYGDLKMQRVQTVAVQVAVQSNSSVTVQ